MEISQEEIDWLNTVVKKIEEKIVQTEQTNKKLLESLKDNMKYMWDSIYEMDSQEKAFVKNQMSMLDETQQENIKELMSYKASLKSPYFGAIDFDSNEEGFLSYRIGLKGIKENKGRAALGAAIIIAGICASIILIKKGIEKLKSD